MVWFLAIDFGTSVTAAAVCDSRDPVAGTVHFGDRGRFPSAVLVGDEGLFSGSEVLSQARLEPHRLVLAPKRLIGEQLIRVGAVMSQTRTSPRQFCRSPTKKRCASITGILRPRSR